VVTVLADAAAENAKAAASMMVAMDFMADSCLTKKTGGRAGWLRRFREEGVAA
jgi:hypothetical protein